jgi:hypothetical protein
MSCKLVAVEGFAEAGFLLKNFQSVPPGEYSLAQVAQALRLLVERATNAEADALSRQVRKREFPSHPSQAISTRALC